MKRVSALWRLHPVGLSAALLLAAPLVQADDAAQFALGRKLFNESAVPACALCHTLKDAGSSGAIGPVLDEIKPDAGRVARALRNGLGQMPAYAPALSEAQIAALALYVSKASGGAP